MTRKVNENYVAFRRLKNFACIEIHPQADNLLVYLKLGPADQPPEKDLRRDMGNLGHFGTGDVGLRFSTAARWNKIAAMIQQAYEEN